MRSDKLRWAQVKSRALRIDGDRVVCRVAGKGPVLLLVHGMAGSSMTWRYVMPALAERFTVLAPICSAGHVGQTPWRLLARRPSQHAARRVGCGSGTNGHSDRPIARGRRRNAAGVSIPERCERLVLVDSGGLGREVTFYLRMLTVPGFDSLFPLFCTPRLRDAGSLIATWLHRAGMPSTPASQEIWRSYASLADEANRRAFFRGLHDVIDFSGQAVSALRRLYRAAQLPTLIVWGAQDPFIPVQHGVEAHRAIPGSRLEIFEGVGHYPHCEDPSVSSRCSSTSSPPPVRPACRRERAARDAASERLTGAGLPLRRRAARPAPLLQRFPIAWCAMDGSAHR